MSAASLPEPVRRLIADRLAGAWLLVGALAFLAGGLWITEVRELGRASTALDVPWWAIVIGYFVAESLVIHLHFRSESGTFSLQEVPLVFGLLFVDPTHGLLAMLIGSFASLALIRRQPALKLAFNLANLSLHLTLAFAFFHLFVGDHDPLSPQGWLAVVATTSAAAMVNFAMIIAVIMITERQFNRHTAASVILFAFVVAVANSVQALVAVLIIVSEPWAVLLLAVSAGVLFVAYRGYLSERQRRERVEFLYTSTRALREGGQSGSAVAGFLAEAASMFRATTAMLYLFPTADSETAPALFVHRNGDVEVDAITASEEATALAMAEVAGTPILVERSATPPELHAWLRSQSLGEAMIGALPSDQRVVGLLVVADRLGNVTTFTETDLRLFCTLVEHAAVSLEKDQLGQALVQLRELGQELEHQAKYDSLTGLANRRAFLDRLDELDLAGDNGYCLLYIDLDDFKPINDTYGHGAGDALLAQVASRIQTGVRPTDLAARLGGDEFAVVLTNAVDAEVIANRLIGSLQTPFQIGDLDVQIGASVGLAHRADARSGADLVRRADVALYEAKQTGKGTVVVYGDHLRDDMVLQSDLRRAVAQHEFVVHYQPIVRLADRSIVGAEALVRWRHPSGRLASPAEFIHQAEQSGLISSVDRLVRIDVLAQLESFRAIEPDFFVSMNLSARHLLRSDLVQEISADLLSSGADPDGVVFELAESALAGEVGAASTRLDEIRALGPRLALDDFGTGSSSLGYLRSLPVDVLKIAQPFVRDLTNGDTAFVAAIVGLGQQLDFRVIAEGIENEGALNLLQSIGCELGQGYFFARPMEVTELTGLLDHRSASAPDGPASAR